MDIIKMFAHKFDHMAKKVRKKAVKRQTERFVVREIKGKRSSTWEVKGYKLNGERVRSRFKTEGAARAEAHSLSLQTADGDLRTIATRLTLEELEDAQAALKVLDGKGSLLHAAQFYSENFRNTSGLPLQDALTRYLESKERKKRSERTIYEIRNRCEAFIEFVGNKPIDQVLQHDLEEFLSQYNGQNYNNYRTKLFSFFKWAEREKLCTGNPVDLIERIEIDRNPEFLSPDEATDLLRAARDTNKGELLAYLSIALFAGLRPDSELKKLTWRGVNFEDSEIQVPKGKTGVARTVKASANLMQFLRICDRLKPIIPKGNFQRKFAAVKRAAGFKGGVRDSEKLRTIEDEEGRKPWIPDITRHSYITYHIRNEGDIYKTATAAGNSPSVIKAHYEGAAKSSEATAFWSITPNTLDGAELLSYEAAS